MEKMKNSGIEWKRIKIKYNGDFWNGLTYSPQDLCDEGEGTLVLRSSNIKNGKMAFDDNVYVKCPIEPKSIIKKNDILICSRNGSKELIGKNAIFEEDEKMAFGAFMMIYRCNNPKYMYFVLNSDIFKENIGLFSTSTVNQLTGSVFGNIRFPLPPPETQKRIADFLDEKCVKIDGLKNDIQKQIETLEQYKKSVITEAVTKGINPNAKMKDSGSKWMPLIPEHWNMDKLKYNLTVHEIKGYGDKEVLSLYRELGIVPKNSRDDNHNVTSEDTSKYKYVRKGDFVINKMKAWQGSVAVSDYEGIVSPAYCVYEFITENYDKRYFHHLMRNKILADEFRRISGGIREGQWDLDREQFENMYLPVPPKSEQIAIADFIDSRYGNIEKSVELKKHQLEKLEEYKKSLIFEYVTGKREVSCEFPSETSGKKEV